MDIEFKPQEKGIWGNPIYELNASFNITGSFFLIPSFNYWLFLDLDSLHQFHDSELHIIQKTKQWILTVEK